MAGSEPRRITVLGATGSVGASTLDVVSHHPDLFDVEALTANGNATQLAELAKRFGAKLAVVADPAQYATLKEALSGSGIEAAAGPEALCEAAGRPAELVMSAIVGAAGLAPTLSAVRRGAAVALANKESLVCAGHLVTREVARCGATLLPVDSEHNAIFQVLDGEQRDSVERIILTASGGPFLSLDRAAMAGVTPRQACAHPNWDMGAKISVDSATMMNKGLELIEAHHLFGLPEDRIDILVHPQSVIHSLVAYRDGSVLAQMGMPDMRTPIAYALGWPKRIAAPVKRLDLAEIAQLNFFAPDAERFPALRLAREALKAGGAAPAILNAANEIAVEAFLAGRIGYLEIAALVEDCLEQSREDTPESIEEVIALDGRTREMARASLPKLAASS
ncbi:MAG: 1-deoxy-D-xylulose-5-phosphate reductoisomerase [Limibacillus sp.]|jgi:1-deoxy-D-xylulose-5-phosphate reductoisomerase